MNKDIEWEQKKSDEPIITINLPYGKATYVGGKVISVGSVKIGKGGKINYPITEDMEGLDGVVIIFAKKVS